MVSVFVAYMERDIIKNKDIEVRSSGGSCNRQFELGVGKFLQVQQQSETFVIFGVKGSERMYNSRDHLTS